MLAQKQPPLKECVIAHWSRDSAPKMTGAKVRNRSFGMYENTWVGGYYLKNGGAMASGESLWIDGKYYMFDEDGKVINN